MANALYPKYKQSLLKADASVDLIQTTANVAPYACLVHTAAGGTPYTYSAAHQFYSDLTGIEGTDQQLTTPSVDTSSIFHADNVTFTAVAGGANTEIDAIVIYRKNAGANTTWRLVAYMDTGVGGLPVTPNGGDIVITWNASGIFQL